MSHIHRPAAQPNLIHLIALRRVQPPRHPRLLAGGEVEGFADVVQEAAGGFFRGCSWASARNRADKLLPPDAHASLATERHEGRNPSLAKPAKGGEPGINQEST